MGLPVRPSGAGAANPAGSGAKPAPAPSISEQGGLPSMDDLALPFLGEEPGEDQDSYLHDLEEDPNLELPMLDFGDGDTTQLDLDEQASGETLSDSSDDFELPDNDDEIPEASQTPQATNEALVVPGPPEDDDDIFDELLQKFDVDEDSETEVRNDSEPVAAPVQNTAPRRTPRSVSEVMNLDDDDFSFEDDHNAESSNGFSASSDLDEIEIGDGAPSDDEDWAAEFERMLDEKAPVNSKAERFPEPVSADDTEASEGDDDDDENWFANSEEEEVPEGFDSFGNPTTAFPDAPINRPDSDTEVIDDPEDEPRSDEAEEEDDEEEKPKRKSSGRKAGSKRGGGRVAKASTGLVRALTLIPFIGRFFRPLEKIARFFLPLLVVLLLVGIPMGLYTVALNSIANPTSITFPDEGSAKIGQFTFDKDTMTASGTITNTGDVIADVKPVFTIWTYHISANPRNWAAFKKVGTCEGAQVAVPIDGTKQVSVKCDVKGLDGFSQKASATLVY